MTSKNDITGDSITTGSKSNSQLFRDNYDNIFNKMIERGVINPATLATQHLEEQNTGKDITKMQQEEKQYVYSVDDETFNIESEEEAIELALEEGYETYSRGVVKHIPKHHLLTADVVIDVIADNAWDAVGEMASDFPDVSAEGKEELDKFLEEWLDKYCTPWFYLVEDVVEIKIQQEQSPFNTEYVAEELPKGMLVDEL